LGIDVPDRNARRTHGEATLRVIHVSERLPDEVAENAPEVILLVRVILLRGKRSFGGERAKNECMRPRVNDWRQAGKSGIHEAG